MTRTIALLVLPATIAACGLDVQGPQSGTVIITGSGNPITTFTSPPSAGCPAVHANTVLVDPTHDGGTWWYPQAASTPSGFHADSNHQGKALSAYLRSQGFAVTELGRGATMSADSLLTYPVVIRAGYYYDSNHPGYSAADLAAYAAYTNCARTLVLLAEYLRDTKHDMLADSLGIPLTGMETDTITTFVAHPLTAGVTSIRYIAGSYLANETNPAVQVLGRLKSGHAVMGVLTSHTAKVFFIGDVNGIELVPQPFVANLVAWGFH